MNEEITGGVSPLKKRGGKAARKVTAKKTGKGVVSGYKGRGGYKKSGGGKNPGGYNVHTRFKPRAKQEGPKGGGTSEPVDKTPRKPYKYGPDGELIPNTSTINHYYGDTDNSIDNRSYDQIATTNIETGAVDVEGDNLTNKTKQSNENKTQQENNNKNNSRQKYTYRQAWDINLKNAQSRYKTFEEYETASRAWNNSAEGKAYWANKNKQSNTNTTKQSNTNKTNQSGGTKNINTGRVNVTNNFKDLSGTPMLGAPVKSHAWNMLRMSQKNRKTLTNKNKK